MMDVEPATVGAARHLAAALSAQQHDAAQRRGDRLVSTAACVCTCRRRDPASRRGISRGASRCGVLLCVVLLCVVLLCVVLLCVVLLCVVLLGVVLLCVVLSSGDRCAAGSRPAVAS